MPRAGSRGLFSTLALNMTAENTPQPGPIGINLSDPIFRGRYHGTQRHQDDLEDVVGRARQVGCKKLIVTGSDFQSAHDGLDLAKQFPGTCFATAGIHPCSSSIFSGREDHAEHTASCDPDPSAPVSEDILPDPEQSAKLISKLTDLILEARPWADKGLVAFGEFGLDYDRLHYCNKRLQLHSFEAQLKVAASLQPQLPLFLHSRAAHGDLVALLKAAFGERLEKLEKGGVVHSFTGTIEEATELAELGLHIGINGCSLKTEENCAVVKAVPLDRIMLETDGPWCEVRPSHEGWKYLVEKKQQQQQPPETAEPVSNGAPAEDAGHQRRPRKQQNGKQKKEPEVASRFEVVKKEKWKKGAMVKGRNEPCTIERVAQIVAAIKGVSVEELCEASWMNTVSVFGLDDTS
ncbi:Deoxyribonuclease Tat-D [Escovopsis weberi]|uniref:Deoxyribonuclease Tat-D n=1 Tax=Escovopsis weberi TaxID=150374 RepID=A0A0N0RTN0_ESCWE|nr:Deoxyribonuclease Tat-D [Escovopsis weberi]